jgi:methyl-accepting chemotaxis protein
MTPEHIERTMEFIIENLAQVTVRLDQTTVRLDQMTGRLDQMTDRLDQMTDRLDQMSILLETNVRQTRDIQAAVLILSDLAQIQSQRMDRQAEDFQTFLKRYEKDHEKNSGLN